MRIFLYILNVHYNCKNDVAPSNVNITRLNEIVAIIKIQTGGKNDNK